MFNFSHIKQKNIVMSVLFLLAYSTNTITAQVLISSSSGSPDASAMLDVISSDKGMLIPRVDLDDVLTKAPVTDPATGLLVYNDGGDEPDGFYYWDGTKWVILVTNDGQEVNNFQDTNQEPSGLIQCSNSRTWSADAGGTSIPDYGTLTFTMSGLSQDGHICDLDVIINVSHTRDESLDITLESPEGTVVELTTDNGGYGDDYTSTRFDDDASTSITAGSAPFTGTYRPEGTLADFNGEDPDGDWILRVGDDNSDGRDGTLGLVQLILTTTQEAPWEYVGEASITYKTGSTPVIATYYSANPLYDTGNKIRITRSTSSGSGTVGDILAYSAASPPQGDNGTLQGEDIKFWLHLNAFYHDDASLTDGTTYYYKLWKAGGVETGEENYSIVPMLIQE